MFLSTQTKRLSANKEEESRSERLSHEHEKHISIPYDELQLFLYPEVNQRYLIETLLYSTRASLVVSSSSKKFDCNLVITKHHIWFEDIRSQEQKNSSKNVFALRLPELQHLVKSKVHPELVFVTAVTSDNVRITLSSEVRCQNIMSCLAFVFQNILKNSRKTLIIYYVNSDDLSYFDRNSEEKLKSNHVQQTMDKIYERVELEYKQPLKDCIFDGEKVPVLGIGKRLFFLKQIYKSIDNRHLIHIAKVVYEASSIAESSPQSNLQEGSHSKKVSLKNSFRNYFSAKKQKSFGESTNEAKQKTSFMSEKKKRLQINDSEQENFHDKIIQVFDLNEGASENLNLDENLYYSHTIEKKPEFISQIEKHRNFPESIQRLSYCRSLDFKIQLLFKYIPQLVSKPKSLYLPPSSLYKFLSRTFDLLEKTRPNVILDLEMVCYTLEFGDGLIEDLSEENLRLRQYRYDFLLIEHNEIKKLIYKTFYAQGRWYSLAKKMKAETVSNQQADHQQQHQESFSLRLIGKHYHLSLILYHYLFERSFFNTDLEPTLILELKKSREVFFPQFLQVRRETSADLLDFMAKTLSHRLQTKGDFLGHRWIRKHKIQI